MAKVAQVIRQMETGVNKRFLLCSVTYTVPNEIAGPFTLPTATGSTVLGYSTSDTCTAARELTYCKVETISYPEMADDAPTVRIMPVIQTAGTWSPSFDYHFVTGGGATAGDLELWGTVGPNQGTATVYFTACFGQSQSHIR